MTSQQIIQDATKNKEMKNYSLLDMHLYLVIKQILVMYFNNQISKEQANIQKTRAVKMYEDNKKQYEFMESMWQEHIDNIIPTENLRIKLRKQLLNMKTTYEDTTEACLELNEIVDTCIKLIEIYSGERFV